jgi:hypothetical protein
VWDDDHTPMVVVIDRNQDVIYGKQIYTMAPFLQSCKIRIPFLALDKLWIEKTIEYVKSRLGLLSLQVPEITLFIYLKTFELRRTETQCSLIFK